MSFDNVEPPLQVGERIQTADQDGHKGTVRYVGQVAGQRGLWIGIEWDCDSRGKHDGSTGGQRYFQCKPGAGSFVRPHKVERGISLLEAFRTKYQRWGSESEEGKMYILSAGRKRMTVELVGADKIQRKVEKLDVLQSVSLEEAGVNCTGPQGHLRQSVPNLRELNLANNLISDWQVIEEMHSELPKLEMLDLSFNRFTRRLQPQQTLHHLQTLILNSCNITWQQVSALQPFVPNLGELHLCSNSIQSLELHNLESEDASALTSPMFPSLTLLNLEDNRLQDWSEISKLANLPSLEQLLLSGNQLSTIHSCPSAASSTTTSPSASSPSCFKHLRSLMLGCNKIADWASVDALNSFSSLQDVRLSDNPLTQSMDEASMWYMLVARIGSLTTLNGSQIKPAERRDSEMRYVRYVMDTMRGKSEEDMCCVHPRFTILRTKYGIPFDSGAFGSGPIGALGKKFYSVTLRCIVDGVGPGRGTTKKLPGSTTVAKLKLLCEKLFKVPPQEQLLWCLSEDGSLPTLLDRDSEMLTFLRLPAEPTVVLDQANGGILTTNLNVADFNFYLDRLKQSLE